ncbi:MAG TPA: peptide ABC transporter permease [Tissierella sp.]|nr:peptide ABC transporter permease [Tissierella sp.]
MAKYIIKRIGYLIFTLWIIITITFFLMHAVPGGPFSIEDGDQWMSPAVQRAILEKYHLNEPISKQYFDFLKGIVRFDLGPSYAYEGRTVTELISRGFPVTIRMAILHIVLIIVFGVPLGVAAALKRNSYFDRGIMFITTLGKTLPGFVKATLILYIFAFKLGWFPIFGINDGFKSYVLPCIAMSLGSIGSMTRLNRASMLDVMGQDYIRTARAKGLSEIKIKYKHALRNASLPMVTSLGGNIASALTGSFVIEKIFALPGVGGYFVKAVGNRDYTTIMGVTIFSSLISLIMVLMVDICYVVVDPRVSIDK